MPGKLLRKIVWTLAIAFALALVGVQAAAFAQEESADPYADAVQVDLKDGSYLVDVSLEGGTGRATVASPAPLEIRNARAVVTLVWSSPHYDYMLVAGKRYLPVNREGNSTFVVPVLSMDEPYDVVADTTAMSEPHEIDYTVTLDVASVRTDGSSTSLPLIAIAAGAAGVACVVIMRGRMLHQ